MFSQELPIQAVLRSVYCISRSVTEFAVAANMRNHAKHNFRFSLRGNTGYMTVDNVPESMTEIGFNEHPIGYFSLASNGLFGESGAFRYVRLTVNGRTLLDLDFTKIVSIDELEAYFDCYYFSADDCSGRGALVPIKEFWSINERGHLTCSHMRAGRVPFADQGPFCLLTLRSEPIGDFEAEVGFEQCWRRYGIVFGCEKQAFPYYYMMSAWLTHGVSGALVYANGHNGECVARGAMLHPQSEEKSSPNRSEIPAVVKRFRSDHPITLPHHTLTFHLNDYVSYHLQNEVLHATENAVVYLPPDTPCVLQGKTDQIYRVEFDCEQSFAPMLIQAKQADKMRRLFAELDSAWHSNLPDRNYRAIAVFYRILAELSQSAVKEPAPDAVRSILHYIHKHFTEPTLTVKEISEATGVCESSLYEHFHKTCGMTPKEYVLNCRLHHACAMLKSQNYRLSEVAEQCGFSDVKYFMTVFKREIGISPGKYRNQKS